MILNMVVLKCCTLHFMVIMNPDYHFVMLYYLYSFDDDSSTSSGGLSDTIPEISETNVQSATNSGHYQKHE